jgi:hypothetical protein
MRDPELVARAQYAAAHLEAAWERWRALQGIGETPAQPVVGYVGYALNEPWGQPRAVIGLSAEEAERLADFLERGSSEFGGVGRTAVDRGAPGWPSPDHGVPDHGVPDHGVPDRSAVDQGVPDQSVRDCSVRDHNVRDHNVRDHNVRDHNVRGQRAADRGLEIAQRRIPEQPTAQTRPVRPTVPAARPDIPAVTS